MLLTRAARKTLPGNLSTAHFDGGSSALIGYQSIAVYLDDENAVVRMFVILDRRVGKCTLVKLASNIDSQPEWLQKF
jgi:hypothetical protein